MTDILDTGGRPIFQVALDLVNLPRAVQIAREAVQGGFQWIEAGTPLIKAEGMEAVRALRREFPGHVIVADMKTMDAGTVEVEIAAKAGAKVVFILGVADDSSVREAVRAGKKYGALIAADLIETGDYVGRAVELEKMGVDIICIHVGLDQQVLGVDPIEIVRRVSDALGPTTKVAAAGGLTSETAVKAREAGADVIIVGAALYKSPDVEATARKIIAAVESGVPIKTDVNKKYREEELHEAFLRVSSCNVSDAMHRKGEMKGLYPVWVDEERPLKLVGRAVTVRAYNGDWSKTVEAIDLAGPGDVIVIDACGGDKAVWGELASWSCRSKGVEGVIIDGAIRDVDDIRKMRFPAFAKHVTPTAGEPRGLGEINVQIECGGQKVEPGDWIVADDSGIVVVPKEKAMEMANRAIDVHEKEDRVREEIKRGATLSQVLRLKHWEKVVG
ncbi:MAG: bifunctional hexulose-6-phosphate synthase/ribonuclease regulator [Promethearchaeota archaeon]